MIEFMIYPVSAIMKFWHWLLSSVFGLDATMAWLLSLVGLIVTIRSIVLPTAWIQLKSTRKGQLLQPQLKELQSEFNERTDAEASKWLQAERKKLHKENSYNPLTGCLPVLIQVPIFIGLYQVILRMSRPQDAGEGPRSIGFLTPSDIDSFLTIKFWDVPIPAYVQMPEERLALLGTTREATMQAVLPLALAACTFTAINMLFVLWRGFRTQDWSNGVAVGVSRFMTWMSILMPLILFSTAFTAPLPLAIILYWFGNNFWTMMQFFVLTWRLETTLPLTPEFKEMHSKGRAAYKQRKADKKSMRRRKMLKRLQWNKADHHQAIIDEIIKRREEHQAEKNAKKEKAKLRRQAEREAMREDLKRRREEKAKEKEAQKEEADQIE